MDITFSIDETSETLWKSCGAVDSEKKPLGAGEVAKVLFLQWVREKADLN